MSFQNPNKSPDAIEDILSVMESSTKKSHLNKDEFVLLGKMPHSEDRPTELSLEVY